MKTETYYSLTSQLNINTDEHGIRAIHLIQKKNEDTGESSFIFVQFEIEVDPVTKQSKLVLTDNNGKTVVRVYGKRLNAGKRRPPKQTIL